VRTYGAKGNGVTDDTSAIITALTSLRNKGSGTLYFPAGTYLIARPIALDIPVSIRGDGIQLTRIVWTCQSGGIRFDGGPALFNDRRVFLASNVSFLSAVPKGGTAIQLKYTVPEGSICKYVDIDRCEFAGWGKGGHWTHGLSLVEARDTSITNCEFRGRRANELNYVPGTTAISITGKESPVEHFITNCQFWFWDTCVEVSGTVEGVYINTIAAVAVRRGIHWNTPGGEPLLSVMNSHISAYESGIAAYNLIQATIQNCVIYERNDSIRNSVGIEMRSCDDIIIANNIFRSNNTTPTIDFNAIVVDEQSRRIIIQTNRVINAATAVWLKRGVINCVVLDNIFSGSKYHDILSVGAVNPTIRKL
jgi:hypothetical protein